MEKAFEALSVPSFRGSYSDNAIPAISYEK